VACHAVQENRRVAKQDHQGRARASALTGHQSGLHEARRTPAAGSAAVDSKGLLTLVNGIADTSFLVAFANGRDAHHALSRSITAIFASIGGTGGRQFPCLSRDLTT
jgi:hypothetical protein